MGRRPASGTLRVAYLTGEYPRATDTWIQREIASLRQRGVEVDGFAVRQPGDEHMVGAEQRAERDRTTYLYPKLASAGLPLAHLGLLTRSPRRYLGGLRLAWDTRRPGVKGTAYQLMYFLEAGLLARAVRRRRIRLLHNHFGDSSCTVAMLAAQLGGFSFSFTLHGPGIFFEPYTWRLDAKLDRAAFCACISYFCRSQAAIFAPPEHLDRLHIVHCGVYPDALPLVTHRPGAEDSTSTTDPGTAGSAGTGGRLLFVARLTELKGVSVLLEALAAVIKAHPGTQLTIIGDGPGRDRFEQLTRDLGLDQAVTFAGYLSQTEVTEHLAGTDVFVLPSYAEGVPVTLMEALGSGVPVVATQVGGVSELVKHGHNGFIVRPGDPDELAERVCQLLAEPELRQQFGAAGRALVAEEFATPTEAARLHTLFANTVAGLPTPLRPDPAPAVQDAASRP